MKYSLILILLAFFTNCSQTGEKTEDEPVDPPTQVQLITTKGDIILELSDKTPQHRDNFIKIVNEGWLDSMLFHRVLEGFVVQAGLYDSLKAAGMDSTKKEKMDYLVPAEFDTSLFHKRGALGAARTGNPERASSSLSFYFVHRGPRPDSIINKDQDRINGWLQQHYFINAPQSKAWKDSLQMAQDSQDWKLFTALNDTIQTMAESYEDFERYEIPDYQRRVYQELGGTPHLDRNYTVFGEVVSGMDVVDSIAVVEVNEAGWPNDNVYILSAKVLDQ